MNLFFIFFPILPHSIFYVSDPSCRLGFASNLLELCDIFHKQEY